MSEISREEAIKELSENNCVDCACGSSLVPTPQCKWDCKHKDSIIKAISDMQKLEKIEHIICDIGECEELEDTIEEKVEKHCEYYRSDCNKCMVNRIEQILRGNEK